MKILLITQLFHPEPNHLKGLTFAKKLIELGHQVEVLTCYPNYPGGNLYPGYKIKLYQREVIEGVPIIRVAMYPSHDNSGIKRMISYASFALSAAILGPWLAQRADIVHIYQGPATLAWPAWIFRLFYGTPYILDVQDLWPDSLKSSGMFNNALGLKIVSKWCAWAYKYASKIITLSPGLKKELIVRGVPDCKIEVIYNWCEESLLDATDCNVEFATNYNIREKFTVLFAGTMGKLQGLEYVIQAASIIAKSISVVQFIFVGGGVELDKMKEMVSNLGLTNVHFHPRQPGDKIGRIILCADVLLITLKNEPFLHYTIPQKTQAYLAIGKPLVINAGGDATLLVNQAKAGLACLPDNPQSIADAVTKLYYSPIEKRMEMGANGRTFYLNEMSFEKGIHKLEDVYIKAKRRN